MIGKGGSATLGRSKRGATSGITDAVKMSMWQQGHLAQHSMFCRVVHYTLRILVVSCISLIPPESSSPFTFQLVLNNMWQMRAWSIF